jgi:pimeloyl-ACP methyl ester carboxylesterase
VVERLVGAVSSSSMLAIEGAGHAPHLSHPARFAAALTDFLLAG